MSQVICDEHETEYPEIITHVAYHFFGGVVREQSGAGVESDGESRIGTPQWVKVFGVVSMVLILLFVISHLAGNGLGGHR